MKHGKAKGKSSRKYEAPVTLAFVVVGVFLAYFIADFTYGRPPDDGEIAFAVSTRTASADSAKPNTAGTQANFGTKAANLFSQFASTATAVYTATPIPVTPSNTPVSTEEEIKRNRGATRTATTAATRPPTKTKIPSNTPTRKPKPTGTGTKVPTKEPPATKTSPPASTGTPMPPRDGAPVSVLLSLQGSSVDLSGSPFAAGVTAQSWDSCKPLTGSFLCRLVALILQNVGEW